MVTISAQNATVDNVSTSCRKVEVTAITEGGNIKKRKHSIITGEAASSEALVTNKIKVALKEAKEVSKYDLLRSILNYHIYDVEFLNKLSLEMDVDISDALNAKRPTREGIMKTLISKLI